MHPLDASWWLALGIGVAAAVLMLLARASIQASMRNPQPKRTPNTDLRRSAPARGSDLRPHPDRRR
jgi:hypothetical protein